MLNVLELIEMRREIMNGVLFIGLIYGINYFVKNIIISTVDENVDECDIQLESINENDDLVVKLQDKKEYLILLNNKLEDIKIMLQKIKNDLNNK